MAEFITAEDLPAALQSHELVDLWVAGANAQASREAPCLVAPTSTAWAGTTAYAVGEQVVLSGGKYIEATVAGTSAASAPTAPTAIDGTVTDGTVTWKLIAPTADQLAEAKLVLVGAVQRWAAAGSGALSSETVGPFGVTVDTRASASAGRLWPSEREQLQAICSSGSTSSSGAFSFQPGCGTAHLPWCNLYFGATYCSCGVDIAGYPIFETVGDDY